MSSETTDNDIAELRRRINGIERIVLREVPRIITVEDRLDKIQDANLSPLLESSALLVELRRIADALELASTTPDLLSEGGWLDNDPYGSQPPDKLAVLKTANDWTTNLGLPGPANAAIGEIFALPIIPQWWLDAMRFVNEEIPAIPWLQPDGAPLPEWRVFPTWAAAGAAAGAAAWGAAGAAAVAAWDAAARDAARDAARKAARVAAHGAARASAWGAARGAGASWGVAGDFAWSAAKSAALHVDVVHVCSDLPLDQEYIDLARNWWHVWQKGYGLYADVNGVLYVHEGID